MNEIDIANSRGCPHDQRHALMKCAGREFEDATATVASASASPFHDQGDRVRFVDEPQAAFPVSGSRIGRIEKDPPRTKMR